jgi:hypothetical protein
MFLKIEGQLIDVLGEKARGNIQLDFGIVLSPIYQFLDREIPITIAKIVDSTKVQTLLNDSRVTLIETVTGVNAEIDALYNEKYSLVDSTTLSLDFQITGKTAAEITGYDTSKPLTDNDNLKALYDGGFGGIRKSQKPPYFVE